MTRKEFIKLNIIGSLGLSFLNFSYQYPNFTIEELTGRSNKNIVGAKFKLHKEAYSAFIKMKNAAKKEDIDIRVISSYRDYGHQNRIWSRKYNNYIKSGLKPIEAIYKIIEYSTIPGTSRHHWGTDLDIIDGSKPLPKNPLLAKHFESGGPFCQLSEWMDQNAKTFGFYLVYTDESDRKGFKYEPWHFSYAPLSTTMLQQFRKLDLVDILQKNKLLGSNNFDKTFIDEYVNNNILDINPVLVKS